jgi:hypothetical protein
MIRPVTGFVFLPQVHSLQSAHSSQHLHFATALTGASQHALPMHASAGVPIGVPTAKPPQPTVQPDFEAQGPGLLTSFGKGSISQTGAGPVAGGGGVKDWVNRALSAAASLASITEK